MFDWIGWAATAIFTSSYFFSKPASLRRVQALASLLWLCYGAFIHSLPMMVANAIVAAVAAFSSFRPRSPETNI
jgi:hypothetical protein